MRNSDLAIGAQSPELTYGACVDLERAIALGFCLINGGIPTGIDHPVRRKVIERLRHYSSIAKVHRVTIHRSDYRSNGCSCDEIGAKHPVRAHNQQSHADAPVR